MSDAEAPRPSRWRFVWVAPLTFVVHALGVHADRIGLWGDDALYLSIADSMRRGGALVADVLPGSPGVAKYPLLWPAVVAGLQSLGASLDAVLVVNAALWAISAQLVVSVLMPALGASWRSMAAAGGLIAVNTMTMDLVPQLMSEPLFTVALTAAAGLVVRAASRPRELVALTVCVAVAAGTRNVGGLYALAGALLAFGARRWVIGGALLAGWALAAVALRLERSLTTLPSGDTLDVLRYYVSYDVHTAWYADAWRSGGFPGLVRGAWDVVTANIHFGPLSLGLFLSPSFGVGSAVDDGPGSGTSLLGAALLAAAALACGRTTRARPLGLLLLVHVAVFLLWTWPFSSRFWLPLFPILVALAALGLDGLGRIGGLLVLPVAALVTALNGIQPWYAARHALGGSSGAAPTAEDRALDEAVAGLAARVRPDDVIAGDTYVFWLARPLGAAAVELRKLVPFDAVLADVLQTAAPRIPAAAQEAAFASSLRTLRQLTPAGHETWVAYDPRRVDPTRDWIAACVATGLLRPETEIGLLRLLSVTPASPG